MRRGWLVAATHRCCFELAGAGPARLSDTPEDAATALAAAVKSGATSDMLKVLGPDAEDIVASGDDVADAEARQRFRRGLRRQAFDQGGGQQEGQR